MYSNKKILTKNWIVALLALLCCILWGSAFPCIKIGYQAFHISPNDTGTQVLFAGLRFTLAGILTILIGSLSQRKILYPKKENISSILKLCMLQTFLQYFFFYVGLAHTTGVKGAIITGSNTLIAILAASLLYHQEKLTAKKIMGCFFGFLGIILANLAKNGMNLDFTWNGEGFLLLSASSYAFSSIYLKRYSQTSNPVLLSGYQFIFGGFLLTLTGLFMGGRLTDTPILGISILIYLSFVSAIAYSLWGILLKYNPISKVTIYGFMKPVIGVFLSAILLSEIKQAFHIKNLFALTFVAIGIYIVNYKKGNS